MKTSKNGVEMIKSFEGCILHAYDDGFGNLTIGYGHCANDVYKGQIITQSEAEQMLINDLKRFEDNVNKYVATYNLNQNEFDALVSFAYNIGNVDELLNYGSRDKSTITTEMLTYCHAGGQVVEGLQIRRKKEVELFNKSITHNIEYYAHLVCDTLNGKYGVDEQRKKSLGEDYRIVQGCINTMWDYIGKNIK